MFLGISPIHPQLCSSMPSVTLPLPLAPFFFLTTLTLTNSLLFLTLWVPGPLYLIHSRWSPTIYTVVFKRFFPNSSSVLSQIKSLHFQPSQSIAYQSVLSFYLPLVPLNLPYFCHSILCPLVSPSHLSVSGLMSVIR